MLVFVGNGKWSAWNPRLLDDVLHIIYRIKLQYWLRFSPIFSFLFLCLLLFSQSRRVDIFWKSLPRFSVLTLVQTLEFCLSIMVEIVWFWHSYFQIFPSGCPSQHQPWAAKKLSYCLLTCQGWFIISILSPGEKFTKNSIRNGNKLIESSSK